MINSMNPGVEQRPLEEALALWRSINGVKLNEEGATTFGAYRDKDAYNELIEAVDLDPTDITATLLLSQHLNDYLDEQKVSLASVLRNPEGLAARMKPIQELSEFLNDPDLLDTRDRFINAVRSALKQYGAADRADIEELFAKPDEIAILRRDALRSIKNLRVDQFLDGNPEPVGIRPVYTKVVHQWWNVNSMLSALTAMPAGVSLNLIRSPGGYQSYFAFVIRNGGNLFILTDVPETPHPLAAAMSRRPDRELQRRAARNWFPYDLLDVGYDEESGRLYMAATSERSLVAYQPAARPLKPISELEPQVVIWLAMMFDLIVEKFWKQGFKAPALSYTGEMLRNSSRLLNAAEGSNLPVPKYDAIDLQPLTMADVHSSAVREDQVGKTYDNPNAWLEERYKDAVQPEILNLTGMPEVKLYLEAGGGEIKTQDAKEGRSVGFLEESKLAKGRTTLNVMNATSFGSREQVEADRVYIARANYASQIGTLAQAEYEARKDDVMKWYLDKVKANKVNLMLWAGYSEVWCGGHKGSSFGGDYSGEYSASRQVEEIDTASGAKTRRVYHQFLRRTQIGENTYGFSVGKLVGEYDRTRGPLCDLSGNKASYYVTFSPTTAAELALLAGCEVQDLPDVLQHWTLQDTYRGNEILNRIDPLVWKTRNPWVRMNFRVSLAFSKRGMEKVSKEPIAPPVTNFYEAMV